MSEAARPDFTGASITALLPWRRKFAGSVSWRLSPTGIGIDDAEAVGTPGEPATVLRIWGWFGGAILAAATEFSVPVELIVACIAAESAGGVADMNRVVTARRNEPGWTSDDETPSRVSIGCMQTLISTARAALGQPDLTADDLANPSVSIRAGTAVIRGDWLKTGYDPPLVGASYNAGGVLEDASPGNRWRLVCYPAHTGAHVDRFVAYFNDAMRVGRATPGTFGVAPSFARAFAV
jgi:hypothetical protein